MKLRNAMNGRIPMVTNGGGGFGAGRPSFFYNPIDNPTLNTSAGALTFTRSTTALEFGSNGLLQSYAINTPRFGYNQATLDAKGLLIEAAATQLVTPLASVRDMSDASWVKVTMAAAKTATGADGVVNSASTLTATAGTATILQTLVAAGSSRTYSALVKRRTGTGTVLLLHGASTLDITSLINSTTYTLVRLNANALNAAFGFQINTNGDAIDVDYNQFEAGTLATSRIPDTGTTRGADLAVLAVGSWFNAAQGALLCEFLNPSISGTYACCDLNDTTTFNRIVCVSLTVTTGNAAVITGNVVQSNLSAVSLTGGAVSKIINVYAASDFVGYANGTSLGTDAAGTVPTVTRLEVGSTAGIQSLNSYVRKVSYYNKRITNAAAQGLTT